MGMRTRGAIAGLVGLAAMLAGGLPWTIVSPMDADPPQAEAAATGIESFDAWMATWSATTGSTERAAIHGAGLAAAHKRRLFFRELIQSDPGKAISLALPYTSRRSLPRDIAAAIEQPLSLDAAYEVHVACGFGEDGHVDTTERWVVDGTRRLRAFTFGRRLDTTSKDSLSVIGVAVDDVVALDDSPTRQLPADEVEARGFKVGTVAVESLGRIEFFSTPDEAAAWSEALVQAEDDVDPRAKPPRDDIGAPAPLSAYTEGDKSVLYMICDFPGLTGFPVSHGAVSNAMLNVTSYFHEVSFAKTRMNVTYVPGILRLPKNGTSYTNSFSTLMSDARAAALAAGYDYLDYDLYVVLTDEGGSGTNAFDFGYAGKATVGNRGCHLVEPSYTLRTAGHELGHNFGLRHANYWRTDSDLPVGPDSDPGGYVTNGVGKEWVEYGHRFSVMSGQSTADMGDRTAHFGPREKLRLDWITAAQVVVVTNSRTVRLFRFDHVAATQGPFAIHIDVPSSDYTGNQREYWLGYRMAYATNHWLRNGVQVDWVRPTYGSDGAIQLDMSPYSNDDNTGASLSDDNNDKYDGALLLGRTASDVPAGIHVTPVARGGTAPDEWIDLTIVIGNNPTNRPPSLVLTASATNASTAANLSFTATASDPDGDAIAYAWDFGLPKSIFTNALNRAMVTNSWPAAGEYVVRCVVSDMRGGRTSTSIVVRIGSPTVYRITGRALRNGEPVEGVRVHTAYTNMTYTTSDGRFTLSNLRAASFTVGAQQAGVPLAPGFANPVTVPASVAGIDFGVEGPPALRFAPNPVSVAEGAATVYVIRLDSRPTGTVTVSFTPDGSQVTGTPASVAIAPNEWIHGKTVSVWAINDALYESDPHTGTVFHAAASPDTAYAGATATLVVQIAENDFNTPPQVTLDVPPNAAACVEGTEVLLTWTCTDDGTVTQAVLHIDNAPVVTRASPPWQATWTASPPGLRSATVVVRDNSGLAATSDVVSITVLADTDGDAIPDLDDPDDDNDGMSDGFELAFFGHATEPVPDGDADADGFSNLSEYIAGTHPTNGLSYFMSGVSTMFPSGPLVVQSVTGRLYTLQEAAFAGANAWSDVSGQVDVAGTGVPLLLHPDTGSTATVFRVRTRLAE